MSGSAQQVPRQTVNYKCKHNWHGRCKVRCDRADGEEDVEVSKDHIRITVLACAALLCSTLMVGAPTPGALLMPPAVTRA